MLNVRNDSPTALTLHIDEAIGLSGIKTLAPGCGVIVSGLNDELRRLESNGQIVITEEAKSGPVTELPATDPPVTETEELPVSTLEGTTSATVKKDASSESGLTAPTIAPSTEETNEGE